MINLYLVITFIGLSLLAFTIYIFTYPAFKHIASYRGNVNSKHAVIAPRNSFGKVAGQCVDRLFSEIKDFLIIVKDDKVLSAMLFGITVSGLIVAGSLIIIAINLLY